MVNLFDVNYSGDLKKDYNHYLCCLNVRHINCPKCRAKGDFTKHAYYDRNIIVYQDGVIKEDKLRILRLRCQSCKTTHALLPDAIIPYHIYTANVILEALKDKYNLRKIKDICKKYAISFQLLYAWIRRFIQHRPLCEFIFNKGQLPKLKIINGILGYPLIVFLETFFKEHSIYFMQFISSL